MRNTLPTSTADATAWLTVHYPSRLPEWIAKHDATQRPAIEQVVRETLDKYRREAEEYE